MDSFKPNQNSYIPVFTQKTQAESDGFYCGTTHPATLKTNAFSFKARS